MNVFTYTLILEEPVIAGSLSGDTNSARSLPFIPGGLVRGALIHTYTSTKNADNKELQRLFLDGATRFLHAYPAINGRRSLPTPLAWKRYKDDSNSKVFNFAKTLLTDEKLTGMSQRFHSLDGSLVTALKEVWQVNVHTQRDAVFGRAKGMGKGAVYRYEALPAGLHLKGAILTENPDDAKKLKDWLKGPLMLGKARTAGYGRARTEIESDLPSDWREDISAKLPNGKADEFTLTFLSETILRDANGQCTLDPLPALKLHLGVSDLKIKHAFQKLEVVGGFNRQWGMPLPQSQAWAGGSVVVVESASGVDSKALADLEQEGLGERKAEGFGRVSISVEQSDQYEFQTVDLEFETHKAGDLSPADQPVVDLMLKRLLRRELEEKMLGAVITATDEYKGGVKNSQLSRWRVNLQSAISAPENGLEKIREFYKREDARNSPSWQKMTRARVRFASTTVRLTDWMNDLLKQPSSVWGMLGYDATPRKQVGGLPFDAGKMDGEYSLRLLDAVLASMTKKNAEGGQDGS